MKKIVISLVMAMVGFIGGIYAFLKWLTKCENALYSFKRGLVDDFEHLLLGYTTIKGAKKYHYQPYYRKRPMYHSNYRTSYDDYFDISFEDDENEEGDKDD